MEGNSAAVKEDEGNCSDHRERHREGNSGEIRTGSPSHRTGTADERAAGWKPTGGRGTNAEDAECHH
eukprot:16072541-Heterocapsa_arctica.AAC.1